jgi:hypothetical protein
MLLLLMTLSSSLPLGVVVVVVVVVAFVVGVGTGTVDGGGVSMENHKRANTPISNSRLTLPLDFVLVVESPECGMTIPTTAHLLLLLLQLMYHHSCHSRHYDYCSITI